MDDEQLMAAAAVAQKNAYAPYSRFAVGAALLALDGRVFMGANVENVSFGLTMCAERVAIGSAIQAGTRHFARLVIVSDSNEPIVPCGACRQVLAEFNPKLVIVSATSNGRKETFDLGDLLPLPRQGILK